MNLTDWCFSAAIPPLAAAVRAARDASNRQLEVKPYPQSFKEWVELARAKYPRDAWTTPSRFSWSSLRLSMRHASHFLAEMEKAADGGRPKCRKPILPG